MNLVSLSVKLCFLMKSILDFCLHLCHFNVRTRTDAMTVSIAFLYIYVKLESRITRGTNKNPARKLVSAEHNPNIIFTLA